MVSRSLEERPAKGHDLKILVVRFSAIGDCVMAAWPVTAIRQKYPDAEIVWACESRCGPVIDHKRLVTELSAFPRERWKRLRWSPMTWMEQIRQYSSLRKHRFDLGMDFQGHSKTALCLRLASPKRRFSARATDAFSKRLNPVDFHWDATRHEVDEYFRFLQTIEEFNPVERPFVPDVSEGRSAIRAEIGAGSKLITIQTGAGADDKRYPIDRWERVAESFIDHGFTVGVLGGPSDPRLPANGSVDWVGKLDLRGAIAAVAESAVHLAGDTGTGHIAAAYGVPTVSIFGPTPSARFRPYSSTSVVLQRGTRTDSVEPSEVLSAAYALLPHHEPAISD